MVAQSSISDGTTLDDGGHQLVEARTELVEGRAEDGTGGLVPIEEDCTLGLSLNNSSLFSKCKPHKRFQSANILRQTPQ